MNVIKYIIVYFWDLSRTTKIKHTIISKRKKRIFSIEYKISKSAIKHKNLPKTTYHKTTEKTIIAMEKI